MDWNNNLQCLARAISLRTRKVWTMLCWFPYQLSMYFHSNEASTTCRCIFMSPFLFDCCETDAQFLQLLDPPKVWDGSQNWKGNLFQWLIFKFHLKSAGVFHPPCLHHFHCLTPTEKLTFSSKIEWLEEQTCPRWWFQIFFCVHP